MSSTPRPWGIRRRLSRRAKKWCVRMNCGACLRAAQDARDWARGAKATSAPRRGTRQRQWGAGAEHESCPPGPKNYPGPPSLPMLRPHERRHCSEEQCHTAARRTTLAGRRGGRAMAVRMTLTRRGCRRGTCRTGRGPAAGRAASSEADRYNIINHKKLYMILG